ncbi:MAG: hypothetical protein WCH21_07400 [Bacteroidota bacterium]
MKKLNITQSKSVLFTMALAVMIMLSSCSERLFDFTVISSKNVTMNVKKDAPRVVGKKSGSIKGALDNAIEKAGPGYDAIVDGVIYRHETPLILFTLIKYHVEGTPVKTFEIEKK